MVLAEPPRGSSERFCTCVQYFGIRAAQCDGGLVLGEGQCVDGGFAGGDLSLGSDGVRLSRNGLNRVVIGIRLL